MLCVLCCVLWFFLCRCFILWLCVFMILCSCNLGTFLWTLCFYGCDSPLLWFCVLGLWFFLFCDSCFWFCDPLFLFPGFDLLVSYLVICGFVIFRLCYPYFCDFLPCVFRISGLWYFVIFDCVDVLYCCCVIYYNSWFCDSVIFVFVVVIVIFGCVVLWLCAFICVFIAFLRKCLL